MATSYFKFQVKEASSTIDCPIKNGVAIDSRSSHVKDAHVYCDGEGAIYSVVLTRTDVENRKNSYHRLQLLESDDAFASDSCEHWLFQTKGEIGAVGYMCSEIPMRLLVAVMEFEQTFLELTGNSWKNRNRFKKIPGKMVMLDLDVKKSGSLQLEWPVQNLIKVVFNLTRSTIETVSLNSVKWPLGRLSEKQMEEASETLGTLFEYLLEQDDGKYSNLWTANVIRYTNQFYSLLPRAASKNLPLLNTTDAIQKEYDFLDKLKTLDLDTCPQVCQYYTQLNATIRPLDIDEPFSEILRTCVQNTCQTHPKMECVQIFEIQRDGEKERFAPFEQCSNRRLLWHGTKVGNLSGILSQGLRIAGVARGGSLGAGIYFSDMISKSLQYCGASNSIDHTILLFLCEVALGTTASGSMRTLGPAPDPLDDIILEKGLVFAAGRRVPLRNSPLSSNLNEYAVYNEAQVKIRYLVQLKHGTTS